ncbi:hypothetical protein DXG01_009619 [Tephrocybe rancida]|nr:hypothetical protein DXG01_009619 [Tephrocybe rancida]
MATPAPRPSPPPRRARAHDQPSASDLSSLNPLTEPSQCTTTPRAIRAAKRGRLSGPTSPTIAPIITAPLPLGSIAMPAPLRYSILLCKPSLHLRSLVPSPPPEPEPTLPESGDDKEEGEFGTVAGGHAPLTSSVRVNESVAEPAPGAKGQGEEVEEVLGSPMRVDAEVQVDVYVC